MEKESTENRAESDPIGENSIVALYVFVSSIPTVFLIFSKT